VFIESLKKIIIKMTPKLNTSPSALEQLADLTQTLEKEKVELTPEVEEYVRSHVRAVQDKLQAGKPVYESDLEFIPKVKIWVRMPKEWREKYPSVEEVEKSDEYNEAKKRRISLKQWLDLLQIMEGVGKGMEWIYRFVEFPGKENIKIKKSLNLRCYTELTELPEGLKVGEGLYLSSCTGLTKLPEGLSVGRYLDLRDCTGLTKLPEGLKVGRDLNLVGCTGLTSLPNDLEIENHLGLSPNLNEKVKRDAERLKSEGKIKGEIQYLEHY